MSGHAILHVMDDMSDGSRGASVLELRTVKFFSELP